MALDTSKQSSYQQQLKEMQKQADAYYALSQNQVDKSNPYYAQYQGLNDLGKFGSGQNKGKYWAEEQYNNLLPQLDALKQKTADEDQRIKTLQPFDQLQQKQQMRADQFRQAFPSILDSKLSTARTDTRRQIAEGLNTTRANYNQRGLLYSGLRAGAEGDVAADAEKNYANLAVKTNQELNDTANQLDQDAIETGLTMGNISKDLASTNADYRKALIDSLLEKDNQRQQMIGGLLGTGAQIAGYGLGAAIK